MSDLKTLAKKKKKSQHFFFFFSVAFFLPINSDEQPCESAVPAGLPAPGLLWPGCGLWPAGSFPWHAHTLLYGCRGNGLQLHPI